MRLSRFLVVLIVFALSFPAEAQQTKDIHKIGYLSRDLHPSDSRASRPRGLEAFREGLRELGYIEGKNIITVSGG